MNDHYQTPANGSIVRADDLFLPRDSTNVPFEIPVRDGPISDLGRIMTHSAALATTRRGDFAVAGVTPRKREDRPWLENARPHPFASVRPERVTARGGVWEDEGVAELRRRGLVFTGREFERMTRSGPTSRRRTT